MKIVFVLSRFPYPIEKGDKLRAWQQLRNLHQLGHEIHLVALSDVPVKPEHLEMVKPWCASVFVIRLKIPVIAMNLALSFFRNLPLQVGYFYSRRHHRQIRKRIQELHPDVIYAQLIRTALFARDEEIIPKVIDYQDAFSKGTGQRIATAPFLMRPLFRREFRLVKEFEKRSYNWFDGHCIISEQDRQAIHIPSSLPLTLLPNGIDTGYFTKGKNELKFDITFVGNMNYPPNVDGTIFLIKEIMPEVWKEIPGATVQLAGANPHPKVRALAENRVTVTGWVDDIRDCYRRTRVFIAPMRIGTGLQNKLLEAMAMGIPCVTTPISFEPLGAIAGKHILVGNSPDELARELITLLRNAEKSSAIGEAGHEFVADQYSLQHSGKLLSQLLADAVGKRGRKAG